MRFIGSVETERQARNLSAWLIAEGVDTHVEAAEKGFEIWARQEDQVERARKELAGFLANPDDSKYDQAHSRAAGIAKENSRKQKKYRENVIRRNVRTGTGKKSPLVVLLIAISCFVALLTNFGANEKGQLKDNQAYQAMAFTCVKGPAATSVIAASDGDKDSLSVRLASFKRGEVWRLLTPIFIHFDTLHLIFNMIWLWQLGRAVEFRYGTFLLGMLVLFTAISSNLLQGTVPHALQGSPPGVFDDMLLSMFGGMSGVVYGLFGFVWMKASYDRESRLTMPSSTVLIMIAWFFFCMTGMVGNIANWTHGVGLVTGMIAAFVRFPVSQKKGAG